MKTFHHFQTFCNVTGDPTTKEEEDDPQKDAAKDEVLVAEEDKKCQLLEHLKDNLTYWKEKPPARGQEAVRQMNEAFSCAYPVVLSRSQADQIDQSAFESVGFFFTFFSNVGFLEA